MPHISQVWQFKRMHIYCISNSLRSSHKCNGVCLCLCAIENGKMCANYFRIQLICVSSNEHLCDTMLRATKNQYTVDGQRWNVLVVSKIIHRLKIHMSWEIWCQHEYKRIPMNEFWMCKAFDADFSPLQWWIININIFGWKI